MRKIIALSSLLALGALGMACGDAAPANNATNKPVVANAMNAANSAMNAANTAMNSAGNAMNSAGNAMNSAGNAMNSAVNKMADNKMAPANTTAANAKDEKKP
jgi:hypothetical protein